MFEFGALGEILIIAVAALVLIGPKEMPQVLRFLGKVIYKVRSTSSTWRSHINQYIHEGEVQAFDQAVRKNIQENNHDDKP